MKRMRKRRKRLSPMTILGVIVLTLTLCTTFGYRQSVLKAQSKEYASQLKDLKAEQQELSQKKKDLTAFKKYIKSDEYAEEVAREKFGLVHKGEIIFEPAEEN